MEIMTKVICPYCKEWLDIEKFLTLDDLKNEYTYKECYLCNKHFALRLKTSIHAKPTKIEREIEVIKRTPEGVKEIAERYEAQKKKIPFSIERNPYANTTEIQIGKHNIRYTN